MLVPLTFRAAPDWLEDPEHAETVYDVSRYAPRSGGAAQKILKDRIVLSPRLDLSLFRGHAVIDWIEIHLPTMGCHQAINIQRRLAADLDRMGSTSTVFVSGDKRQLGYTGSSFILRIQQPEPWELVPLLKKTWTHYARHEDWRNAVIAGVEVSVDFVLKKPDTYLPEARNLFRTRMTDLLRRHLRPEPALTQRPRCAPRFFDMRGGKGSATLLVNRGQPPTALMRRHAGELEIEPRSLTPLQHAAHARIPVDRTAYIGAKDFSVMLRTMHKTTDRRDPNRDHVTDLPEDEWRSRVEVALLRERMDELGGPGAFHLATVKDLYGYRFERLRRLLFAFFLPTFATAPPSRPDTVFRALAEDEVFARSGVYGLDRVHRALEALNQARTSMPPLLGKKGYLVSFEALNRRFDTALKGLTHHWRNSASPFERAWHAARARR